MTVFNNASHTPALRRILAIIFAALVAVHPALAAEAWTGSGRRIIGIYPQTGGLTFYINGVVINPSSPCEPNRMILLKTHLNYDVTAGALLTAFAMDYPMSINYDTTTTTQCDTVVNRMQISK